MEIKPISTNAMRCSLTAQRRSSTADIGFNHAKDRSTSQRPMRSAPLRIQPPFVRLLDIVGLIRHARSVH
jgi:hypothetical protein